MKRNFLSMFAAWALCCAATVAQETAPASKPPQSEAEFQKLILEGARNEAAKGTPYIEDYKVIAYPGGDVPEGTGVCTDLVVRAFRNAGLDLQKLLHEDRAAHPEAYPLHIWDRKTPDPNIDHRRCQNLVTWFKRHTAPQPTGVFPEDIPNWQGGDVIFFTRKGSSFPWHVAIVSDKTDGFGMPLVIDSFPPQTSETHPIDAFGPIGAHFRVPAGGPAFQKKQPKKTERRAEPRPSEKPAAKAKSGVSGK